MLGFVLDSEDAVRDEAASLHSCGLRSRAEKSSEQMNVAFALAFTLEGRRAVSGLWPSTASGGQV